MTGLADTLAGLSHLRSHSEQAFANLSEPLRLSMAAPMGRNPGELRMLTYVPPGLPPGAPLVVALHGCTQNAAAYDHGSGWSRLAERHGFAVLFPEQRRTNNANLCFNWFEPHDVAAGQGEVESIREMIEQMIQGLELDRRRVFITGLSAGGAMTAAMLATAPGLFAGGAVIAGLPYGAASSVNGALSAMSGQVRHSPREWGDLVRAATPHAGPWPQVQIWQGTADHVVAPANAQNLVQQWTDVAGLPADPARTEQVDGATCRVWPGASGYPAVMLWTVPGLGHGVPVAVAGPDLDHASGTPGPHMLAAPIDATYHLAKGWGLLTAPARRQAGPQPGRAAAAPRQASGPAGVVERALRAAGLLR